MKGRLSLIGLFAVCLFVSCKENKKAGDSQGEKNLATANAINQAVQAGDVSKLGDYIATDAVDHAGSMGDVKGIDSIKAELAKMKDMMKDRSSEKIKELGDNDYTFQWMKFSGTTLVEADGMPAGTTVHITALHISKFKDGKVVEHWEYMQPAEMMKMMPQASQ